MNQPASSSQYFPKGSTPVATNGGYPAGRRSRRNRQATQAKHYIPTVSPAADHDGNRPLESDSPQMQTHPTNRVEPSPRQHHAAPSKARENADRRSHTLSDQSQPPDRLQSSRTRSGQVRSKLATSGQAYADQLPMDQMPMDQMLAQEPATIRSERSDRSEIQVSESANPVWDPQQSIGAGIAGYSSGSAKASPGPISAMEESARKLLDLQAEWVNQLSDELEAALLRLKVLSGQCNARKGRRSPMLREFYKSGIPSVPQVDRLEGDYVLRPRRVDLHQAEQLLINLSPQAEGWEGSLEPDPNLQPSFSPSQPPFTPRATAASEPFITAESQQQANLAQQSRHHGTTAEFSAEDEPFPAEDPARSRAVESRSPLTWLVGVLKPPVQFPQALRDAAIWVLVATALRISMQVLQSSFPQVWMITIAVLVLMTLFSVYQVAFVARAFGITGYRLVLVAVGLAIGGRL